MLHMSNSKISFRAKVREHMIITDTPLDVFDKLLLNTVGKLLSTTDENCQMFTMQDHLSKYIEIYYYYAHVAK